MKGLTRLSLDQFQRITSSGTFIPEIDGLRFVAIASVVAFHINHYLQGTIGPDINLFENGWRGVQLFFVISGFILALPFANYFLRDGKPVRLKQYYLRRITRLEPPYFVALAMAFALIWWRRHSIPDYAEYVASFKASLFYIHNFLWPRGSLPLVNPVTWSLEIEVQFYVLAPLVARVYQLSVVTRRLLLITLILIKVSLPNTILPLHASVLDVAEFFLTGFLVADLFVSRKLEASQQEVGTLIGALLLLAAIWFLPARFLAPALGLLFVCCFKSLAIRKVLSNRWVTTIGGMCYSIYLIHWVLITTLGGRIVGQVTKNLVVNYALNGAALAVVILLASVIFFKLIERPCMARDWHKRLLLRARAIVLFKKPVAVSD